MSKILLMTAKNLTAEVEWDLLLLSEAKTSSGFKAGDVLLEAEMESGDSGPDFMRLLKLYLKIGRHELLG